MTEITKEKIHTRNVIADGYRRSDGLYEIIATITDCKHYPFHSDYLGEVKPEQFFHNMELKLVLDTSLLIKDIQAQTLASPFAMCPKITQNYKELIGIRIRPGWSRKVKQIVGQQKGCTHISELLLYIGTVAIQTIYSDIQKTQATPIDQESGFGKALINSCHAWAEDSPVTQKYLPKYFKPKQ